jgi:hypothetical protein
MHYHLCFWTFFVNKKQSFTAEIQIEINFCILFKERNRLKRFDLIALIEVCFLVLSQKYNQVNLVSHKSKFLKC